MIAKQYLRELSRIELNIKMLTEELEERRTRLTSTAAPTLGDKVQSSPQGDAFATAMAAIADKDLQRKELLIIYEIKRDQIVDEIRGLEDATQAAVLYARYVQHKRWDVIALELHFSIQRVFQVHGNALISFTAKYLEV